MQDFVPEGSLRLIRQAEAAQLSQFLNSLSCDDLIRHIRAWLDRLRNECWRYLRTHDPDRFRACQRQRIADQGDLVYFVGEMTQKLLIFPTITFSEATALMDRCKALLEALGGYICCAPQQDPPDLMADGIHRVETANDFQRLRLLDQQERELQNELCRLQKRRALLDAQPLPQANSSAPTVRDGPCAGGSFCWEGTEHEPFGSYQWRLLNFLWDDELGQPKPEVDSEDAIEFVYGHDAEVKNDRFRGLYRSTNDALKKRGLPFVIEPIKRCGKVRLKRME